MYTVTTTWPAFILSAGCPVRRDWLNLQYRFLEDTMDAHLTALSQLVQVMVHRPLDGASLAWWYGQALFTLPYVRKALLMRPPIERDLRNVRMPVLLTHGLADRITLPESVERGRNLFPHASLSLYPETSHAPLWEESEWFNRELVQFARAVFRKPKEQADFT
jgi:pimeloyl-ACP methyl ester carboxylesterase